MVRAKIALGLGIVAGFAGLLSIAGLWQNQGAVIVAAVAALVSMLPLMLAGSRGQDECCGGECESDSASTTA